MTNWVCKVDGTVFTVGAERCPSLDCGAQDAYEQGGDPDVNVYDLLDGDAEVAERLGVVPELVDVPLPDADVPDADMDLPKPREKRS